MTVKQSDPPSFPSDDNPPDIVIIAPGCPIDDPILVWVISLAYQALSSDPTANPVDDDFQPIRVTVITKG